jgi:hypothetical protein
MILAPGAALDDAIFLEIFVLEVGLIAVEVNGQLVGLDLMLNTVFFFAIIALALKS